MSLPPMLSMFIQAMYNVVDSIFVSWISQDALTALSLAYPLQYFSLAIAVGTGVGLNSVISRKLGAKDIAGANSAATHGLLLAVFSYIVIAVLSVIFIQPFFRAFSASPAVYAYGCEYSYIVMLCSIGLQIHLSTEKTFQAVGNMIFPMLLQLVGAIVNIILDPVFIFTFGLGVKGAAIATAIGQGVSMVMSLIYLFSPKQTQIKLKFKGFKLDFSLIKDIYAVGFPMMILQMLISILNIALNAILIKFSEMAVALFGVYSKLQTFIFMPVSGLSQGEMPILGFNYGAKNKIRMKQTLKYSFIISSAITLVGTALFCFFPEQILLLFNASEDMLAEGAVALRVISSSYIFVGIAYVVTTLYSAIGKGMYNLVISLLRQLVIILPLAYFLSKPLGLLGIWLAFPITEILATIVAFLLYVHVHKTSMSDAYFEQQ